MPVRKIAHPCTVHQSQLMYCTVQYIQYDIFIFATPSSLHCVCVGMAGSGTRYRQGAPAIAPPRLRWMIGTEGHGGTWMATTLRQQGSPCSFTCFQFGRVARDISAARGGGGQVRSTSWPPCYIVRYGRLHGALLVADNSKAIVDSINRNK